MALENEVLEDSSSKEVCSAADKCSSNLVAHMHCPEPRGSVFETCLCVWYPGGALVEVVVRPLKIG